MAKRGDRVTGSSGPTRRGRRIRRLILGSALAAPVLIVALWIAVNRVEWLGPWVADGLRAVVGAEAVTQLEDFAYSLQDRVNRLVKNGEAPKAYWEVPEGTEATVGPVAKSEEKPDQEAQPKLEPFAPKDVGPALNTWSAPGDGIWVPKQRLVLRSF